MPVPNERAAFPATWETALEAELMHLGSDQLAQGKFADAIQAFDAALAGRSSIHPFLWQRGIAYYYAGRYGDRSHVSREACTRFMGHFKAVLQSCRSLLNTA